MKNVIKLLIFLTYTILIFFIKSYLLITAITAINIIMMLVIKVNLNKALKNLMRNYDIYIIYSFNQHYCIRY